jgi:hypothetical protein
MFLNMMWPLSGQGLCSYYYHNTPNMFDQFLVSRGIVSSHYHFTAALESAQIIRFPEMVKTGGDYPTPIRFGRGNNVNNSGFSDHFPIALKLLER